MLQMMISVLNVFCSRPSVCDVFCSRNGLAMNSRTKAVGTKIEALGAPKRGQNEAKMEPRGTKNDPKVDKSETKGEVWDHM